MRIATSSFQEAAVVGAAQIFVYKTLQSDNAPLTRAREHDVMARIIVDPLRCEGKKTCAEVCPEGVFRMERAPTSLPIFVLLKVFAHGGRQAVVVNEVACTACMKCVEVCPENAIHVTA